MNNKVSSTVTLAGGSAFTILSLFMSWMIAGFPKPVPGWVAPTCAAVVLWLGHFCFNLLASRRPAVAAAATQALAAVESQPGISSPQSEGVPQ